MHISRSILLLMTGAVFGIASILSCGDNLSVKTDAVIDAASAPDAAPSCDCPAAEPPLSGRFKVFSQTRGINGNESAYLSAFCPPGSQVISGSCTDDMGGPNTPNLTVRQSGIFDFPPSSWHCDIHNNDARGVTLRVSVICLTPP